MNNVLSAYENMASAICAVDAILPGLRNIQPTYKDMASATCTGFNVTPEDVLKELNESFARHNGHTGGFPPVSRSDLLFDPVGVMRASKSKFQQKVNRKRIAALLWLECKISRIYLKKPDAGAELFIRGLAINSYVMALTFPELQDAIMKDSRTLFGRQGKYASQAQFHDVKKFCEDAAKKSWAENTGDPDPPAHMAQFIFDAIKDPGEFGLTEKPSIDRIKGWIKPHAPEQAKRPGRPRKQ